MNSPDLAVFGIRPGGWLLLINGGSIGWCSFAHVYGSPGSYSISTAGHCGKVGDVATVVGVVGNRTPVLMDIGKFSKSTGDGGIGKDWALISVIPEYQHLVTPTMAFWGGPFGTYTKTGESATFTYGGRSLVPTASVNSDPFLVQQVLHYGHGTGIGAGGTPAAVRPSRGARRTSPSSEPSPPETRGRVRTPSPATAWGPSGRQPASTPTSISTGSNPS